MNKTTSQTANAARAVVEQPLSTAAPASNDFAYQLRYWRQAQRYSQLQISIEADVSQRHISFLESGRAQPSRTMVLRLADALQLSLQQQNQLLVAAGFAARYQQSPLEGEHMLPVRQVLQMQLSHHDPYPALVADQAWNMLMSNSGMDKLLALAGDVDELWQKTCADGRKNLLKLMLHPDGLRRFTRDWQQAGLATVQRLRREAKASQSQELLDLLDEAMSLPGIPEDWNRRVNEGSPEAVLTMTLSLNGLEMSLISMVSSFGTPQDITAADLRVELFYPADEASADLLRLLSS